MKKLILIIFIMFNSVSCFAVSEDTKLILNFMDKRFEQVDKRFEQVDKRFDTMQKNIDKRFEQVDKRFETMQKSMDRRFEQVDNKFYLVIAVLAVIFGYLLKERKYISRDVEELVTPKIENIMVEKIKLKTDKSFTQRIVTALEELAQKDEETRDLLKRHHLQFT